MMDLDILMNQGLSRFQFGSNLLATFCSRLLDLFQGHFAIAEFSAHRTAKETVLIEHMDFSEVSRVESNDNLFLDEGCERNIHVAMVLEMNAVLLDTAG